MKNVKNKLFVILLALVVLGGVGFYVSQNQEKGESPGVDTTSTSNLVLGEITETENPYLISYSGEEGKMALELLKENAEVVTKDSDFGEFVQAINGIEGGTEGKYWMFYVNEEPASVGAGDYVTQDGDLIEWRFE